MADTKTGLKEATNAELADELASREGVKATTLADGVHATLSERGPATILVVAERPE